MPSNQKQIIHSCIKPPSIQITKGRTPWNLLPWTFDRQEDVEHKTYIVLQWIDWILRHQLLIINCIDFNNIHVTPASYPSTGQTWQATHFLSCDCFIIIPTGDSAVVAGKFPISHDNDPMTCYIIIFHVACCLIS